MAPNWPLVRVEEFADKVAMGPFGSNIKVETFVDSGVPVISGAHLRGARIEDGSFNFVTPEHAERLKNSNVLRGDVVFTHAGNIGQVAYVPESSRYERYVISQRQFYLRCDRSKADPAFITYFFHSPEGQHKLLVNASQVGVPSISRPSSNLKEIEVALPPLAEQRAIAGFLGSIDDRIDNLRQTNATLEAIAQALFKSWFVDFDPVRAKAEGREPEGMDAATADLFPSEFEDSELGPIPKGWTIGMVGNLMDIKGGKQLERTHFDETGPNPIYGGAGEMGRTERHNAEGLVITVGRVGAYCGKFCWHLGRAWVNNNASRVTPHSEIGFWAYWCLRNTDIEKIKKGAAQPFVSNSDIARLPIIVPGVGAMGVFQSLALTLHESMMNLSRQVESLSDLRDILLPRLISGQLRIPDAEREIEAATA